MRKDSVFVAMDWGEAENVNDLMGEGLDGGCKMGGFKVWGVGMRGI